MKQNICKVFFEFNPLGDLEVIWEIPVEFLKKDSKYSIQVPGFKYDLPKFLSIPVPFSSKAIPMTTEIIYTSESLKVEIKPAKYGNFDIEFTYNELGAKNANVVILKYKIQNILNADGVYFVAVYPFRTPFENNEHQVNIECKFSYNVRLYSFWERYFEYPSNKKLNHNRSLNSTQKGDEFKINGIIIGNKNQTIDLHITGTRFPFYIRRDIFWFILFIISTFVFLSPFIGELNDLFNSKSEWSESINYNFTLFKF